MVKSSAFSYKLIDTEASGKRKRMILHLFDAIAPTYDLLNRVLSFGVDQAWRRAAANRFGPLKGRKILDLCCGTGDLTGILRQKGAAPTSLDFSEKMIRKGMEKKALDTQAVVSDASFLPFKDNAFDGATVAFGVRNIPDLTHFIKEANRVLVPGGMLVILELVRPESPLIKPVYHAYLNGLIPIIGKMISKNSWAYDYLAQTIGTFIDPETLSEMLVAGGFEKIKHSRKTLGIAAVISGKTKK
jgi:demethylmenaquinone methyltransferase / 2-methoxy-6-polyprenyl-1,4-benzoquinol methylase